MYDLPRHKEHNAKVIDEFILQYPFALLTGCDAVAHPVATQVPLLFEEKGGRKLLVGHLMRNTDHHNAFAENKNVLAVFTGKHTYVRGTWYSNPYTASTWNYMSVHMKGEIAFLEDSDLEEVLRRTTLHFEHQDHQSPTVFDNLPLAFKEKVMHMIVAFEIEIENIDTVFKLSQDRDAVSYQNIIDRLKAQRNDDGQVIAVEMEKRMSMLFGEE